ncbi:hypothetical protein ASG43_13195 [Aureimonas sp. Leaf454]|uniref:TIGR03808 family TAT-translocated repetitive protein n=1 Tax=Aureimonas sp. Leaf454 TaxID=1736381 RepID=UPI0006FC07FE|nr:TIGR03808 family TAT-translocated repetitive protein [Aureimonas sp. Leaf454]KQT45233.1 hypothetical protein ASG43_13195 [Aureimonas sp. Leaf454]
MPSSAPTTRRRLLQGLAAFAAGNVLRIDAAVAAETTRRLQASIEESAARNRVLVLPPGDYPVGRLELPPNARLAGTRGATRIFGRDLEWVFRGGGTLQIEDIVFDGLSEGASEGPDLLAVADCPDLRISGCTILGARGSGLALHRCGGRVADGRIAGAGFAALLSRDATGLSIRDMVIEDCGHGGILVHRSEPGPDGTLVADNRMRRIRSDSGGTGQTGNGINVFRAHAAIVSGNHVEDCAFSAIRSNGGSNVSISGNTCLNSGETAIYSEFRFDGAVITGNLVDGAAIGISIANFNEGGRLAVCSNNLVRNLRRAGPYPADAPGFGMGISVEADTALNGNVVEGAPLFGLKLGWGPFLRNVSATGNVVRDCGTGIAISAVEGSGTAIVSGNVVAGSRDGAIRGFRWSEVSTADLLETPGETPPHVKLLGNSA